MMHVIPNDESEDSSSAPVETQEITSSTSNQDCMNGLRFDKPDKTNIDRNHQFEETHQQFCLSSSSASPPDMLLSSSSDIPYYNSSNNNISSLDYSVASRAFIDAAYSSIQIVSAILHEEARNVKKRVYETMTNRCQNFGTHLNQSNKNLSENNVMNDTTSSSHRTENYNEKRDKLRHMSSSSTMMMKMSDADKKNKLSIQQQAMRMKRMSNLLVQLDTVYLQIIHEMKQCEVQQQQQEIIKEQKHE